MSRVYRLLNPSHLSKHERGRTARNASGWVIHDFHCRKPGNGSRFVKAVVDHRKEQLDALVEEGKVTAERAEELVFYNQLQELKTTSRKMILAKGDCEMTDTVKRC